VSQFDLRCHRCSYWIGETHQAVEFVGAFKRLRDREQLPAPRDSRVCEHCGWVNVFRPLDVAGVPALR